eukprot:3835175-Pyramimonas_sp.AAC.1
MMTMKVMRMMMMMMILPSPCQRTMQRRSSYSSRRHSIQHRPLEGLRRPLPESEVNGCQFLYMGLGGRPKSK